MIAAIYARKSTDQSGVADEQKSVTRQIEQARAYASERAGPSLPSTSTSMTASAAPSFRPDPATCG